MAKPLSTKQHAFVEHYLTCWSETEAARRAGYANPNNNAHRLMVNDGIQAAIATRLSELKMSADEVLTRLSDQARGSMAPFIRRDTDGDLYGFDLSETQPLQLIKKASITRRRQKDEAKDEIVTVETITIELYDAQAALGLLGKHHKLFADRVEHTGADGGPITVTSEAMTEAAKELEAWRKQMSVELSNTANAAPTPPTSSTPSE